MIPRRLRLSEGRSAPQPRHGAHGACRLGRLRWQQPTKGEGDSEHWLVRLEVPVTASPSTKKCATCRSPGVNAGVGDPPPGPTGPCERRHIALHADGRTRRDPRLRCPVRGPTEAPERHVRKYGDRRHGRLPPQNLRGRNRCSGHRFDCAVDTRLIGVRLQQHSADAPSRALEASHGHFDIIRGRHPSAAAARFNPPTWKGTSIRTPSWRRRQWNARERVRQDVGTDTHTPGYGPE